jgi:hypothetical protein
MQKQQIIKSLNSEDIVFERMESTPEEIVSVTLSCSIKIKTAII